MKFYVQCSLGEILDKITILELKYHHCINENQYHNIRNELNELKNGLNMSYLNDKLYNQLYSVNSKLWNLEDSIRQKSKKKEYDDEYISFAEDIHKTNDLRAYIKKQINIKYNSNIIEEKIYN